MRNYKRVFSLLLAVMLIVSSINMTVFAVGEEETQLCTETVGCTKADACAAETHEEGCPKYAAPSASNKNDEPAAPTEPAAPAAPTEPAAPAAPAEPTEPAVRSEAYQAVLALFAALPAASEITEENKAAIEAQLEAAMAAYEALEESETDFALFNEEQAELLLAARALMDALDGGKADYANAAEVDGTHYATLAEAVAAAQPGKTVKLLKNVHLSSTLVISADKNITLDLAGYEITVEENTTGRHYYAIDNYGTFVLKDSVGDGSITARGIENLGGGKMTIQGGAIIAQDTNGGAAIWNVANLTIEGGTFRTTHVGSSGDTYGPGCLNNSGTALITGGKFESVNKRTYAIISTGKIEITPAEGKTVEVAGAHGGLGVDSGTAVVNGGSFSSTEYYGLYVSNDGLGTDPMQAAVTVNGGTFTGLAYSVWIGSDYNNPVNSTIEINGGYFNKPLNAQECTREGAIAIKGGYFTANPTDYVDTTKYLIKNTEDAEYPYSVELRNETNSVARIGDTFYETLADAVAAAQPGETIKLIKNWTVTDKPESYTGYVLPDNAVLDLGGYTLTVPFAAAVFEGANITIQNGRFESTANYAVWIGNGKNNTSATLRNISSNAGVNVYAASVILEDCNIDASTKRFYAVWGDNGNVEITIKSGIYSGGQTAVINASDGYYEGNSELQYDSKPAKITIEGGSFTGKIMSQDRGQGQKGQVSVKGGNFTADPTAYVDTTKYLVQHNEGEEYPYHVELLTMKNAVARIGETPYKTLKEAIEAVPTNGSETTVELLKTVNVAGTIAINGGRNVKLNLNGNDVITNDYQLFIVSNAKFHVTGNGTLFENVKDGYAPIIGKGSANPVEEDYTVITIDSGVTLKGDYAGIFVAKDESGTYNNYGLVINVNGTIDMGAVDGGKHYCGIYVNGTNIVSTGNVMKINLNGATIKNAAGEGIYAAGYADWTINGGSITGGSTGIEIRAGKLTVNDGAIITGNGKPASTTPNGNGSTAKGAGIAVVQHTTKLPINVTINDGTISGYSALYQQDAQNNGADAIEKISITVNGGKFKAINGGTVSVYSENKTGFIKGGVFSVRPDSSYVVAGKAALINDDPATKAAYAFKIGVPPTEVTVIEVTQGAPEVKHEFTGTTKADAAEEATTAITGSTNSATMTIVPADSSKDDISKQATDIATNNTVKADDTSYQDENGTTQNKSIVDAVDQTPGASASVASDVTIVVQTYTDVQVADITVNGTTITEVKYDITPMAQKVATTNTLASQAVTNPSVIKTTGDDQNAVKIGKPEKLEVNEATFVTIPLPNNFLKTDGDSARQYYTNEEVYIKHVKEDGSTYTYKGTITNSGSNYSVTFLNPHGFSEFTVSPTTNTVASITRDATTVYFDTLQDAVNYVADNETIEITKNIDPAYVATVNRSVTFVVSNTTYDFDPAVNIRAGYSVNMTYNSTNATTGTFTATYIPSYPYYPVEDPSADFWNDVESAIKNAKPGQTVKVNAKDFDKMPWQVMETLRASDNVTLLITWNGGKDITIPASKALKKDSSFIYYPLSYLAELDFGTAEAKPETSDVVENTTPDTPQDTLPGEDKDQLNKPDASEGTQSAEPTRQAGNGLLIAGGLALLAVLALVITEIILRKRNKNA